MNTANTSSKPLEAQDQASSGQIDVTLVDHLLTLSYEERIEAHELARELARDLTQAGNDYYARQSEGPA